jgi:hypothetical protein
MKLLRAFNPTKPTRSLAPLPATLKLITPADDDWYSRRERYPQDVHVYRIATYNLHTVRNKTGLRVVGAAGVLQLTVPTAMPNGDKLQFTDIEQLGKDPDSWDRNQPSAYFLAARAYEADTDRYDRLNRSSLTDEPRFDYSTLDFRLLPQLIQQPILPPGTKQWYRFSGGSSLM